MDGAKYENERTYNGRKLVVWVIVIFFLMSVVCSLGTYFFGEGMAPYLQKRQSEAVQQSHLERGSDVR